MLDHLSLIKPPCPRCLSDKRMLYIGEFKTDFGGEVAVWGCQKCGVVGLELAGKPRPAR
jgi:hypothetical protein